MDWSRRAGWTSLSRIGDAPPRHQHVGQVIGERQCDGVVYIRMSSDAYTLRPNDLHDNHAHKPCQSSQQGGQTDYRDHPCSSIRRQTGHSERHDRHFSAEKLSGPSVPWPPMLIVSGISPIFGASNAKLNERFNDYKPQIAIPEHHSRFTGRAVLVFGDVDTPSYEGYERAKLFLKHCSSAQDRIAGK
eukprot:2113515-Pleurochrysis_carterae.AAC.2